MAKTTADVLFERLVDWGVDVIFGLPGDGINGFMEALRTHQEKIRFIQVRHEEGAAFAACGYAKFSGTARRLHRHFGSRGDPPPERPLRRQARRRPGARHHRADLPRPDGNALPAGSQPASALLRRDRLQSAGHGAGARPRPGGRRLPRGAGGQGRRAHQLLQRLAGAIDLGRGTARRRTSRGTRPRPGRRPSSSRRRSRSRAPRRCSTAGRRPSSSPGRGRSGPAMSSSRSPTRWPRRSSRRCSARRSSPTTPRITTGGIGLLGTLPSEKAMEECDTLLIAGSSFPYMQFLPEPDQAKAVQIDRDPTRIGLRYPIDIGLTGDAKATLQALLPLLQRRQDRSFLETAQKRMQGVVGADAQPRGARRCAAEAAGGRAARQRPARRQRHHHDRLGHDHHLGRAAPQDPPGHEVLVLGQPGHDGAGPALRQRGADRLPRPAGRRLRGRRRLHDADDGVRHGGQAQPADQGHHHQEQHARADQVGADGLPRQPRIRRRAPADRLRAVRRRPAAGVGFRCEKPEEVRPALEAAFAVEEAGARRGGRRPVRAAPAGARDVQAGAAHGRGARARRAAPRQDRR